MWHEIKAVFYKEMLLEWKQRYAFNGLLLYVVSMVIVVVLSFIDKSHIATLSPLTWSVIYWLMLLFVAMQVVAKSFMGEQEGQLLYLYQLARPNAILAAKMLYNVLLLLFLGFCTALLFWLLGAQTIENISLFLLQMGLGCVALSTNLTLIAAIAAKAENKQVLLAVLSFPLTIPVLVTLIRISRTAIEGFPISDNLDRLYMIGGIALILAATSFLLFPFLWRD